MHDRPNVKVRKPNRGDCTQSGIFTQAEWMQRVVIERRSSRTGGARRKGKLHLEATDRLRAMIVAGELPPGRAAARSAAVRATRGFADAAARGAAHAGGRGDGQPAAQPRVVVAKLHSPDIGHLYRVFGAIEGLAGELACARVTEAEIAEIADIYSQMVNCTSAASGSPTWRSTSGSTAGGRDRRQPGAALGLAVAAAAGRARPRARQPRSGPLDSLRCSSILGCWRRLLRATGRPCCAAGARAFPNGLQIHPRLGDD